jgi:LmbE family N-acetylglucosaminyl deacetylase
MSSPKTVLVISAHAADFVWRCGGAIALHAEKGYEITVACLSFGERGESAKLWKEGKSLDEVKAIRKAEAEAAARALGVHRLDCFDLGDYPLHLEREDKFKLVDLIRKVQPAFMMCHSQYDPYNTDHMYTTQIALECRMVAQAWGHNPGETVLGAPQLYLFEPRCLPRHHPGLGEEAGGHGAHERSGPPLGLLHPRGAAARQSFQAELRRAIRRARLQVRRRISIGLSTHGGRIVTRRRERRLLARPLSCHCGLCRRRP